MEQAYDSMGWPTLDNVLKWYGFPTGYAKLIMECITDVIFSIIINGRNSKWIMAYSGFRQGCPLSPYLYILCSQLLSNSIHERGSNIGIQISSRGPKITHLLYADDVIIFSQCSKDIAKEVKRIVDDFCSWTGQRVNDSKSQIMFGNVVGNQMRKKITKVLNFKNVKEMNYLGIKLSLNRLRAADFHDILTNMMDRLNTWGKKFLSLGGKVTLTTSSLLTMPNYLITHSMITKKVLLTMEKLCRSFIWDKHDGSHGIHYIAWEDLCKPKNMGGLGLQSPTLKTGPLRANLSWNFLQKPDTLFHRVMRAKYGNNILNGTHKKSTSKAWRILLDGGKSLKNITRWNIGNGKDINVLNDSWIYDKSINQWLTFADCSALEGLCVQHLMLDNGQWNSNLLQNWFHPELVKVISNIQINSSNVDMLEMQNFCPGRTISGLAFEKVLRRKFNLTDDGYYNWLKKLKLSKKVEMFWWRLGNASIPTNLYLKNRKLDIDSCARGCNTVENYEHIIIQCKYMVEIINQLVN
ncbi:Putative ribonuclease H protein [Dendrobium catenatum]|uniref:Ribonuclease H protein n=1 Tax=Dendrobium catenatum TaxID=906689 RepID=A0A2I0XIA2_9ASPA|nr:Putative ribonuclease H protein [Dendrobium catenatum]